MQYSQENTCVAVSLQAFRFAILLIRDTNTYVFLRILRNFKEHHFEEHLRTTASYFMNKNGNNSSQKNLINGNLWVFNFVNWHGYKEKFKEIAYKSKQMPGGKLSLLADEIVEWDLPRLDGVNFHSRKPGSFNHHLKFLLILLVSPRESLKYLHYFHSFRIINNYICHKILFDLLSKVFFYIAITTTTPTTTTTTTTTTWIFTLDSRSQICLV